MHNPSGVRRNTCPPFAIRPHILCDQIIWLTNRSSVGLPRRNDETPTTCSG
jgi:hypothetical protein